MTAEEKYKRKNMEIQQCLMKEIDKVQKGLSYKSDVQLGNILKELDKMIGNRGLPLSYPRIIVDTWDFNDELGLELLELAEIYKQLK